MPNEKITIVEDEPKIAQLLVDYLQQERYQTTVLADGRNAVEEIRNAQPSLVILDLMLPGKDGLTICREVREFSNVPIMMLTAKVDEIDRLVGLEIGADDYVCKPFSPREVVARAKAIIRRSGQKPAEQAANNTLTHANITLNLDRFECLIADQNVELTAVEFRLLQGFMSRPGHVLKREKLMNLAYAGDRIVNDRTIDSHIKKLRLKLNRTSNSGDVIHSVYGVGYKFA